MKWKFSRRYTFYIWFKIQQIILLTLKLTSLNSQFNELKKWSESSLEKKTIPLKLFDIIEFKEKSISFLFVHLEHLTDTHRGIRRRLNDQAHLDREIDMDIDTDIRNTFSFRRKEQWNWLKRISAGPDGISMSDFRAHLSAEINGW